MAPPAVALSAPEPQGDPAARTPGLTKEHSGPTARVMEGSRQHKPGPVPSTALRRSPAASQHSLRREWDPEAIGGS